MTLKSIDPSYNTDTDFFLVVWRVKKFIVQPKITTSEIQSLFVRLVILFSEAGFPLFQKKKK